MNMRRFGKTNVYVSEISLGAWQIGGGWGKPFDKNVALQTLRTASDLGINCIDTADVYDGGMSEKAIGDFMNQQKRKPFVITKIGRRADPHVKESYTANNLRDYIQDSRQRLKVEALDMVLLHCPPADVYYMPEVFGFMDAFQEEGLIKHYGVSVARVEEGLKAIEYEGVAAIEIVFNMFRLRPAEWLFKRALANNVGIIARVPLASGLLTGKYHEKTKFNADDHRTFNRDGQVFDKGETFSGVDYALGLKAVNELKQLFETDDLAPIALRWILMFDAVSTIIPGASKAEQVRLNTAAAELPPLTREQMIGVKRIYDTYIKASVHHLW